MKRIAFLFALLFPAAAAAQVDAIQNDCIQDAQRAVTSGLSSSNTLQGVVPYCTVTVYLTGTTTKAPIYSNSASAPLTNPFTANANGSWLFYAATAVGYDVQLSNSAQSICPNCYATPKTLTDVKVGGSGGGGGGVTNFASGNLSPLFTTTVTNPSTTPSQTFSLDTFGNFGILGNFSGSTADPSVWTLVPGTNITMTPFNGNTLTISANNSSSGFQMQITPPLTVNQAFITGTTFNCTLTPCPNVSNLGGSYASTTGGYVYTTAIGSLGTVTYSFDVSGLALPAGWSAANVTAISGYAISGGDGSPLAFQGFTCAQPSHGSIDMQPVGVVDTTWHLQAVTTLSTFSAATISAVHCDAVTSVSGGAPANSSIYVPLVGLIVTDTIDPPIPPSTAIQVDLPLSIGINSAGIESLQYDTLTPVASGVWIPGTVAALLPPSIAGPNALETVSDGVSNTDCTTGGGSDFVVCQSNGTAWSAASLGSTNCLVANNCPNLTNTATNSANTAGNLFVGDITSERRLALYNTGNTNLLLLQLIFNAYPDFNFNGTDALWFQSNAWTTQSNGAFAFGSSSGYSAPASFISLDGTAAGQFDFGSAAGNTAYGVGLKWIGPNTATPPTGSASGYPTGALVPSQNGQWAWNNAGTFQTLKFRVASADGYTTLSSGVSSAQSTSAACAPSTTCVYHLTNCGINSSSAIGILEVTGVSAGSSFTITAVNPTSGATQTNDNSHVCWAIN